MVNVEILVTIALKLRQRLCFCYKQLSQRKMRAEAKLPLSARLQATQKDASQPREHLYINILSTLLADDSQLDMFHHAHILMQCQATFAHNLMGRGFLHAVVLHVI